jgi:hypothetical protein
MEKTSKIIKVLIAAVILVAAAYAISDLSKSKNTQEIIPEVPASSDETDASENEAGENVPADTAEEDSGASAPAKESTPEERESRTVSPSDAASYSDDDAPPDF